LRFTDRVGIGTIILNQRFTVRRQQLELDRENFLKNISSPPLTPKDPNTVGDLGLDLGYGSGFEVS